MSDWTPNVEDHILIRMRNELARARAERDRALERLGRGRSGRSEVA